MATSVTTSLVLPVLLAAIAGLTGAVVTYIIARRSASGTVATSDAATLWGVSNTIRAELRQEIQGLRKEVEDQRKEIAEQRVKITALEAEVEHLQRQLDAK